MMWQGISSLSAHRSKRMLARQTWHRGLAAALGLAVSGCASTLGAQKEVLPADFMAKQMTIYSPDVALKKFEDLGATAGGEAKQVAYRGTVAGIYLVGIDSSYRHYITDVAGKRKDLKTGSTLATLGLGTVGAIATGGFSKSANAINLGITGGAAAVDKELFYDQAMPALKRIMDAERTKVRYRIFTGLEKSASEYPMVLLFADLSDYESVGSIETAVSGLSSAAEAQAANEQAKFQRMFNAGREVPIVSQAADALNLEIRTALAALKDDAVGLAAVARAITVLEKQPGGEAALKAAETKLGTSRSGVFSDRKITLRYALTDEQPWQTEDLKKSIVAALKPQSS